MVQQPSLLVKAGYLAAVAESGIDGHGALLPDRRAQQKLTQILAEHAYAFDVGLLFGFPYDLSGNRRFEQALVGILAGGTDFFGGFFRCDAATVRPVAVDAFGAALRIGVDIDVQVALVLRAQHGEQVVRRYAAYREIEIEVAPVFCGFGILASGFRDA